MNLFVHSITQLDCKKDHNHIHVSFRVKTGSMRCLTVGDSVALGETTFMNNASKRGSWLSLRQRQRAFRQNGGVRTNVVKSAIDGETLASLFAGTGRILSIPGSTDPSVDLHPSPWVTRSSPRRSRPDLSRTPCPDRSTDRAGSRPTPRSRDAWRRRGLVPSDRILWSDPSKRSCWRSRRCPPR